MNQVIFDQDNIKLYYLSPYVQVKFFLDDTIVFSLLTNVTLRISLPNMRELFHKLEIGITYNELFDWLRINTSEPNPKAWIQTLFDYKVIE